jgi:hypothetical protein
MTFSLSDLSHCDNKIFLTEFSNFNDAAHMWDSYWPDCIRHVTLKIRFKKRNYSKNTFYDNKNALFALNSLKE